MKFLNFMTFQVFHDRYKPWIQSRGAGLAIDQDSVKEGVRIHCNLRIIK